MAEPPIPKPDRAAGFPRLGRYELITGIASGGMGAVMLARLAGAGGFQRLFAIKTLHKHLAQEPEFLQMLLDEARLAARIHHPNVVAIQEVNESADHGYYLVMDYVEGCALSDVLSKLANAPPRLRWRITHRVLLDTLAGLQVAHTLKDDRGAPLGVVHRDASPQNVLVGTDGISRVTDFGIAKAAARLASTRAGMVRGKLAYMAPEQARGEPLDARADLFAVGVILWESLTGRRLFGGLTERELYSRIVTQPVDPPNKVLAEIPGEINAVCVRALERQRERRYPSAREMSQALERAVRAAGHLADADEVGEWVRATFAEALEKRQAQLRRAAEGTGGPARDASSEHAIGTAPTESIEEIELEDDEPPTRAVRSGVVPRGNAQDWAEVKDTVVEMPDDDDEAPTQAMDKSRASPELRAALEAYKAGGGVTEMPARSAPRPGSGPLRPMPRPAASATVLPRPHAPPSAGPPTAEADRAPVRAPAPTPPPRIVSQAPQAPVNLPHQTAGAPVALPSSLPPPRSAQGPVVAPAPARVSLPAPPTGARPAFAHRATGAAGAHSTVLLPSRSARRRFLQGVWIAMIGLLIAGAAVMVGVALARWNRPAPRVPAAAPSPR